MDITPDTRIAVATPPDIVADIVTDIMGAEWQPHLLLAGRSHTAQLKASAAVRISPARRHLADLKRATGITEANTPVAGK
jgi:hypothetical protein